MKRGVLGLLAFAFAMSGVARAQSCHPPGSFYRTTAIRGTAQLTPGANADCDLVSTLAPNNSTPAGAFAWYNLPHPAQSLRISFRIDTSQLGEFQNGGFLQIFSASAPTPYPAVNGNSSLLRLYVLSQSAPTAPALYSSAVCSSSTAGCGAEIANPLVDGDLLRFQLTIGAGSAGNLQWWINSDFGDPPTGTLGDLDNLAWGGVDTVALGTFQPQVGFAQQGTSLRYSDIETSDDEMFWNGFDY